MLTNSTLTQSLMALTIAFRYSCHRRQFLSPTETKETLLIDYPLTKYRLMPLVAQNIAINFASYKVAILYETYFKLLTDPTNSIVSEMHCISSTLKAKSSWFSTGVIAECRQMLGGHGFSSYSRLGDLYHENEVNSTW